MNNKGTAKYWLIGLTVAATWAARAADVTWTGGGSSQTNWADGANWSTGSEPNAEAGSAGDILFFNEVSNYAIFDGYDAVESATNDFPNASYYRQIRVGYGSDGRLDMVSGTLFGDHSSVQHRVGVGGAEGTLNISGGLLSTGAGTSQIGLDAGSVGMVNLTGGTYQWGRESSGISGYFGDKGYGEINISGGVFVTRAGVVLGNSGGEGVFHVMGTNATQIGIGSHSSVNGSWLQNSESTLKVGIDAGGVTPILIDDKAAEGPSGSVMATFKDGALLEPYFSGSSMTGKWTVMTVDGFITDEGLAFAPTVTDTNWSFNVVSNYLLEVWYGLGDSGYMPAEGPVIVYTNTTCVWDGEAGDNAFDNSTNWAFAGNNVLPLSGSGSSGAILQLDTTANYAIYGAAQGGRSYNRIHVGLDADGRFDVLGNGYTLKGDNSGGQYIGANGNSGTMNVDGGGTINFGASPGYVGHAVGSTGIVNVVNNGRVIYGRESGGTALYIGDSGGYGEVNVVGNGRFLTRAGVTLGNASGIGVFHVEGVGADIRIGGESSLDGNWVQNPGSMISALVTSNGLGTINISDKGGTGTYATFAPGALLDVDFSGFDGVNGSWDVWHLEGGGSITDSGLAFAPGVDTGVWSFAFVDTDADTVADTLRLTASGILTEPTVQPDITAFSVSGGSVSLTWDSEPLVGYNVLSKTDLKLPTWTTEIEGITGAGSSTSTNLTGSGTAEFYKIEAFAQ